LYRSKIDPEGVFRVFWHLRRKCDGGLPEAPGSQAGTYRLAVNSDRSTNELSTRRDDAPGQITSHQRTSHQRRDKIPFNFQLVCNPNNRFRFLLIFRKDRVFRKINNRDDPKLLSPKRINAGRLSDARAGQNLRGGSSSFQGATVPHGIPVTSGKHGRDAFHRSTRHVFVKLLDILLS